MKIALSVLFSLESTSESMVADLKNKFKKLKNKTSKVPSKYAYSKSMSIVAKLHKLYKTLDTGNIDLIEKINVLFDEIVDYLLKPPENIIKDDSYTKMNPRGIRIKKAVANQWANLGV